MKQIIKTLSWKHDFLEIIDQTVLPEKEKYIKLFTIEDVYEAIKTLKIRGAPAIGLAASFGLLLAAKRSMGKNKKDFYCAIDEAIEFIKNCRPTAYNLFYGVKRLQTIVKENQDLSSEEIVEKLEYECMKMFRQDIESCAAIARYGEKLIKNNMGILTHCNAGALATGGIGTALAPVYLAAKKGKNITVYVDETRPVLQGARLTMWELKKFGIRAILVCDNMAGFLMQQGKIDMVITGADRIARNGDTANKIGTYSVAVCAAFHKIPLYIAAPFSTFDFSISDGNKIPIEQRDKKEVQFIMGKRIAPYGIDCYNPAFDITPSCLIAGFITERGILQPDKISRLTNKKK
ncbi:MAG: S-methyl-5-thioribose-1-phosphate isomerase [Candidatus Omnitrophica bacterium]|nr:S-methyl-5-thioribose-1-phosphate isomerase [Candidatus Omnitrophota bacterium]MCM8827870.1 S-methyl-5-thioribose-1-phosphate isomerase [Candidatus Omnitrophota bacterium]